MKEITIYTDGACSGNPGPGGYGIVLMYNEHKKEVSKGFKLTTNNRMELMAVVDGLSSLKEKCSVKLYSDSKYVVDAINKGWLNNWVIKNWVRGKNNPVSNVDLWKQLIPLLDKHNIEFIWVKGHANNKYNERCDELARNAITSGNLNIDNF